jgi:hypothetical protein
MGIGMVTTIPALAVRTIEPIATSASGVAGPGRTTIDMNGEGAWS